MDKLRSLQEYYKEKLEADWSIDRKVREYVLSGENYEEICKEFEEDFRYVYGEDWKSFLHIPPLSPVREPDRFPLGAEHHSVELENHDAFWVYRLILASKGKVKPFFSYEGYGIPYTSPKDRDMRYFCRSFCQRMELRLNEALKETHPEMDYVTFATYRYDGIEYVTIDKICEAEGTPYRLLWHH